MPSSPFSQPPRPRPQWPLWILGATLLGLLVLAYVYWVEPQGLRLLGNLASA
ncbi:MAG: hypothetical protein HC929_16800 [Leptolyngbyaceae cyanobacterium SM2_5_2]|nr:hypothetical protein [Leptolyngbyaceae cyanobacterium SM2_5_2]